MIMLEMDKYYEAFNTKLIELVNDLMGTFPEIKTDLMSIKHGINMVKNIDPKVPQGFFNDHVAIKYEPQLISRDEQFFLDHDYSQEVTRLVHGFDLDIIGKLKYIWRDLNTDNKDAIWKYIHVLLALNRKCVGS